MLVFPNGEVVTLSSGTGPFFHHLAHHNEGEMKLDVTTQHIMRGTLNERARKAKPMSASGIQNSGLSALRTLTTFLFSSVKVLDCSLYRCVSATFEV